MMVDRALLPKVDAPYRRSPAVVLPGLHQVGKTPLAREIADGPEGAIFMDLERDSDRAAWQRPVLFLPPLRDPRAAWSAGTGRARAGRDAAPFLDHAGAGAGVTRTINVPRRHGYASKNASSNGALAPRGSGAWA